LLFVRRLYGYFHVLPQCCQEIEKPPDREVARSIASKRRYMRLRNAQDFPGFRLREVALLDNAVDLQRQLSLQ
jgi:hypothetical protein